MSTEPLPLIYREKIEALIREEGETATIRRLAVPRNTLIRALAGRPVRAGSFLLIRDALERRGANDAV
jgi:hypothetical protein